MPLARAINDTHSTAPDFFQNLIIAQSPVGIAHIDFSKHILKRFTVMAVGAQTLREQTAQAKSPPHAPCRSTLRACERFLLQTARNRNVVHENVKRLKKLQIRNARELRPAEITKVLLKPFIENSLPGEARSGV